MPDPIRTRCPHCRETLTLKSTKVVGKKVPCPKCQQPFVVEDLQPLAAKQAAETGGSAPAAAEPTSSAIPPVVQSKKKRRSEKARRRREAAAERAEEQQKRFAILGWIATVFWINAHLAAAVCVIDSAIDFVWMLIHFGEIYDRAVIGRFAVRQVARPLFVIITALIVWYQGVLWRERAMRGAVVVFGAGYLLLFGVVAFIVGLLAESVYERPIYAIQWSVIYLGVSLLAFAVWGYGPETVLERAERLTSEGRYAEALTAVNQALEEDPDDEDAEELERTLRDMLRHG